MAYRILKFIHLSIAILIGFVNFIDTTNPNFIHEPGGMDMDDNNFYNDITESEIQENKALIENTAEIEVFQGPAESISGTKIYEEQKNGCINIQSVPVKKHRFKKWAPYIACTLVSAIVGGVAGGVYVNYMVEKYNYTTPITISQNNPSNSPISYTPSNSLIARIAAEVGPSIVGIDTKVVSQGLFGSKQVAEGSGSGIIFDKRGYIITNQHVIDGGTNITVTLPGGKKFDKVQIIGQDRTSDLAVLKINADNLPVARFGDSSRISVGDLAIAIGNPMGEEFAGSVTSGIISALNRTITVDDGAASRKYKLIQTDAAINPGNSGGALINENGEIIGINTIKFIDNKVEGMGFAIPINEAKAIIDELLSNGYVSRPYLGIGALTVTEEMAKQYNSPVGVVIEKVAGGDAAEAAGLKLKDIIIEIDGVKIENYDALIGELWKHKVGDSIKLKIWRDGATITVPVTLGENKSQTS